MNDDIVQIQIDLRNKIDCVVSRSRKIERDAMLSAKREPRLSDAWFDAIKSSVQKLETIVESAPEAPEAVELIEALRSVVTNAETQIENSERVYYSLADLGDETETLKGAMSEMIRLEERMKGIIETGTKLVKRLRPVDREAAE